MYKVYRDPDGKSIRDEIKSESNMSTIKPTDSTDYNDNAYRNKIEMLNMEVIQLRDEIAQVNKQLCKCISNIFFHLMFNCIAEKTEFCYRS